MLLYTDILIDDEMFSDAFPMSVFRPFCSPYSLLMSLYSKVVDDIVYEVDCQLITVKAGADVDIGMSFFFFLISPADSIFKFPSRCESVCRGARGIPRRGCSDGQQYRAFVSPPVNFI